MARHHTDEQKARIVGQYYAHLKAGKSAPVAAKKMGVSYMTLRRWINAGIEPPGAKFNSNSSKAKRKAQIKSKRKTLRSAPTKGLITLTFPDGHKVEANDPAVIILILKALGK